MSNFKDSCGVGFIADLNGVPSHEVVRKALEAVKNLTHRGATLSDGRTGDGSGIMIQLPHSFFLSEAKRINPFFKAEKVVVGTFFLKEEKRSLEFLEREFKDFYGDGVVREVPIDEKECGEIARNSMPLIVQLIAPSVKSPWDNYLFRKKLEKKLKEIHKENYVVSLSDSLTVYKGMLLAPDLDKFYKDLNNKEITSSFAIFHQRYSTNTNPEWKLAQPLRLIAHNGEINTVTANRNFLRAVEPLLRVPEEVKPVLEEGESDSASLDRVFELMVLSSIPPEVAINFLIPPAFSLMEEVDEKVKDFFEYAAFFMKPWDGPAAIVFTDGKVVGGKLDRNGLRPARYLVTEKGFVIFGSEVGMVDLKGEGILASKRLNPGETIVVDFEEGRVKENCEVLNEIASLYDVSKEVRRKLCVLKGEEKVEGEEVGNLNKELLRFGYFKEEIEQVLEYMGEFGKEPVYSMGDDTPLPNFREEPPLLFSFFKQKFAQVTNPPIDPIRERVVMSLTLRLGPKASFLNLDGKLPRRIKIDSPLLTPSQFKRLENASFLKVKKFKLEFSPSKGLKEGLYALFEKVKKEIEEERVEIVILSDKGVKYPIPSLLAVSGLSTFLEKEKLLHKVSLVVETGEARDSHQIASLIAFGAAAVYPYLVYSFFKTNALELNKSYEELERNYVKAVNGGLLKIMSKMGISVVSSYHLSKLFDAVGLSKEVVDEFFPGVFSPIGGITLKEIEEGILLRVKRAEKESEIPYTGEYKFRPKGVYHGWNPEVVRGIFKAAKSGNYEDFKEVVKAATKRVTYIRDLLKISSDRKPIPLEEVEPVESIVRRLFVPGMSIGALSKVAHEVIAEALNLLGSKSCSGEGGEDPDRYGTVKNSKIKQVASGRFGVTPQYLASAEEIEIKIAQGAKPGEGGHLPGHKVTPYIASLRYSVPGVALISPPPHHDIYSIEDLAQLIHDLKLSNPEAKVSVKLVAESGVGTVACGVAKAKADAVQISGGDGGTGASPLTSIKGAGLPWEIGLAETQRELVKNGLRDKVVLRVDGGLKIGRDVVIAALLGAEEFGFGTAAMIAEGCVMDRDCHTNRCPVGIATQDEKRVARFRGAVETVANYFRLVAEDVRRILAQMGYRRLEEIIGKTELLSLDREKLSELPFAGKIDLSYILEVPKGSSSNPYTPVTSPLNEKVAEKVLSQLEKKGKVVESFEIRSVDRSVGALLSYGIVKSKLSLSEDAVYLKFKGVAGQSFAPFLPKGVTFELEGIANDYVAKGLAGGTVVLKFPPFFKGDPSDNVIAGNTVLYGATGGSFYAAGVVGERFAVRNSGAVAVVEGVGKHGCEYMVRGIVVVAGKVGKNFGAGMTGGIAYVLDRDLEEKINRDYVEVRKLDQRDFEVLKILLSRHYKYTRSRMAEMLLENRFLLESFRKVVPIGVKELELKLSGEDRMPA